MSDSVSAPNGAAESRMIFGFSSSRISSLPCTAMILPSAITASSLESVFGKTMTSMLPVKSSSVRNAMFVFERVSFSRRVSIIPATVTEAPSRRDVLSDSAALKSSAIFG